jgi:Rieske Fe-S protein
MNQINRQEFIKLSKWFFTITGLAVIASPVVAFFYPPKLEETPSEPVLVGPESELPLNESKTVRFGRYPAIVINTSEGYRAYSAVCTHFACIVKWDPQINQIVCPCHEGFFDPYDGSVISGPPPTALEPLPISIVNGEILVGGEV